MITWHCWGPCRFGDEAFGRDFFTPSLPGSPGPVLNSSLLSEIMLNNIIIISTSLKTNADLFKKFINKKIEICQLFSLNHRIFVGIFILVFPIVTAKVLKILCKYEYAYIYYETLLIIKSEIGERITIFMPVIYALAIQYVCKYSHF